MLVKNQHWREKGLREMSLIERVGILYIIVYNNSMIVRKIYFDNNFSSACVGKLDNSIVLQLPSTKNVGVEKTI